MFVNDSFKNLIAKTFYDKEFYFYTLSDDINDEGEVIQTLLDGGTKCVGNVQFSVDKETQETYGIQDTIDISITTSLSNDIQLNNVVSFDGNYYLVKEALKSDSHLRVLGTKWKQDLNVSL